MEKIYIEDNQGQNQSKQSKRQKRSLQSKVSIGLSFVLAFVAMTSIIAYGFGVNSFALPEGATTSEFVDSFVVDSSSDQYLINGPIAQYAVRLNRDAAGNFIYCTEADVTVLDGHTYTKDESEITDQGLVFLLHYFYNYKLVDSNNRDLDAKADAWAKQSAIWIYQHEIGATNNSTKLTDTYVNQFKQETQLQEFDSTTSFYTSAGGAIYKTSKINATDLASNERTIEQLVTKAKAIHNGKDSWNLFDIKITKKTNNLTTVTKADTKEVEYFQTDEYTVSGSTALKSVALSLDKDAPKGTEIYFVGSDKAATADELKSVAPGTKFYVRVPGNALGNTEKVTVKVLADGTFEGIVAFAYRSAGSQTLAKVGTVNSPKQTGVDFEITKVPDTGISAAQSIYFVGLIILIAGVGIIYANVKPSKLQQQQ